MNKRITQCAWCKRIKNKTTKEWESGPAFLEYNHGMCPDCKKAMYRELKEFKKGESESERN